MDTLGEPASLTEDDDNPGDRRGHAAQDAYDAFDTYFSAPPCPGSPERCRLYGCGGGVVADTSVVRGIPRGIMV